MDHFKLSDLPPDYAGDAGTASLLRRRDPVAIPVIWIVLLLSVLLHVAALHLLPPLGFALRPEAAPDMPIAVELRPRLQLPQSVPESPVSTSKRKGAPPAPAAVASRTTRPRSAPAAPSLAPSAPPLLAQTQPAPDAMATPAKPEPSAPERVQTPSTGDFASYVEARRRSRGESSPAPAHSGTVPGLPPDDDAARSNRIVAANLGLGQAPTFGGEARHSGGVFQIKRLNYSNAEFLFFGWNKEIRRNTSQLIEVRKGEHSDIESAVIRRMIAIIREYEADDFRWESKRLGRAVMLSARLSDNGGLEDFLMREFFDGARQP